MFAFADPTELWLNLPDASRHRQPAAAYTNAWNAYLNQVCLDAVLDWVQAEHAPQATASTAAAIWEFVNGSAITLDDKRLVLIPTEAMDDAELAVPQEWVDIPNWAGDYYLAVEVQARETRETSEASEASEMQSQAESSAAYIRVWGYASHQDLKAGQYDPEDRTYNLEAAQLTQAWNALWVTLRFCPTPSRAALAPLPDLPPAQADNLIARLGRAAFPRLAIPFELWGALLQVPARCQQLYHLRVLGASRSADGGPIRLGQWLQQVQQQVQQQVTEGWQQLEALLSPAQLALNLRGTETAETAQAKRLELAGETVALVVQISREADDRFAVVIQLHPTADRQTLPADLQLKLLAEAELLQSVQSGEQDSYIQLRRFRCPEGTEFQIELEKSGERILERFLV